MSFHFIIQPVEIERKAFAEGDEPTIERLTNIRLVQRAPKGPFAKSTDVVLREGVALDHNGLIDFKRKAKEAFGLK